MKPGRELDALVAEKVMGLGTFEESVKKFWELPESDRFGKSLMVPKCYSTDIAAAWEIVEKMREDGLCVDIFSCKDGKFTAMAHKNIDATNMAEGPTTISHAICLAALKAVGVDICNLEEA